jgi:hypothetical protein
MCKRDSIWKCFTVVATLLADQNRTLGCHCLVVPRDKLSTRQTASLVGYLPFAQSKCTMQEPTECSGKRWTTRHRRVKAGHGTPECVSMHDEKRPRWRNRVRAWAHRPCRSLGRSPDSRGRGGFAGCNCTFRGPARDTPDELNTTQKCSVLYSGHLQANKRRPNGNSQALRCLERESRHDNDLNVEECSKLAACSAANQRRLRQY